MITDAQTRMLHDNTPPIRWFEAFLQQYSPEFGNEWVIMDQGGKLYNNPEV